MAVWLVCSCGFERKGATRPELAEEEADAVCSRLGGVSSRLGEGWQGRAWLTARRTVMGEVNEAAEELGLWLHVQQSAEVERLGAGLVLHHLMNMARHRGSRGRGHHAGVAGRARWWLCCSEQRKARWRCSQC
jgi:hypothetical protein